VSGGSDTSGRERVPIVRLREADSSFLASLGRRNDKDGLAVRNSTSGEVVREWSTLASLVGVYKNLFNAEDTEDAEKLILRGTTCMMERRGQLGWLRFFRISFS